MVGCWCGCLSGARCRLACGLVPLTVSCFSKIQIGFTFLVPAHLGSPGKRAVKQVCVVFRRQITRDVKSVWCVGSVRRPVRAAEREQSAADDDDDERQHERGVASAGRTRRQHGVVAAVVMALKWPIVC